MKPRADAFAFAHFLSRAFATVILPAVLLAACGLGQSPEDGASDIDTPGVAASVNGRPIYVEDVRTYAVQTGLLEEGEDLDANSDAFYFALEALIEVRLFALEAEARGLDSSPDIRRRLESARERVLANSIYEELQERASDPAAVERLYRQNTSELGRGQEIHLRHIQLPSKEAAELAKRRLEAGEQFEALAFEISTDRPSAAEGGDLRFIPVEELQPEIRTVVVDMSVGQVTDPVEIAGQWHLFKVQDRRERGVPSLETLRPQIVNWLLFEESQRLRASLEENARIRRMRDDNVPAEPGAPSPAPSDDGATAAAQPPEYAPRERAAPPFPFPMGPGGVFGAEASPQAPAAPRPAANDDDFIVPPDAADEITGEGQ